MTDHWILCVDDDERLLRGLELQLGLAHEVRIATSGEAGLTLLREHPDCAAIISDMRMPGMNGAQFLTAAKALSPDTSRLLLTGFGDIEEAISAVNDGGIMRFLTKPTPADVLEAAMSDAIRQWELIRSERVLLEQTLHGASKALIEALEIASPAAFSRARRLEAACRHVASQTGIKPVWEIALAGLMLRLGWVAVPPEIVDAFLAGNDLDETQVAMLDKARETSVQLVRRIPRLDGVASIIEAAENPHGGLDAATVVRAVSDFDQLCQLGHSAAAATHLLEDQFPEAIVKSLCAWEEANAEVVRMDVNVYALAAGMVAEEDIRALAGNVLVRAGAEITNTMLLRLRNFARGQGISEPIAVTVPA